MPHKQLAPWLEHRWSHIIKIDALQCLHYMQLSRLASCGIHAVPIEHAIGGVAILLDFNEHVAGPHGVKTASWKEHGVARFNGNLVNVIRPCSGAQRLFEPIACYGFAESQKKLCIRIGSGHVPELGFWLAT